ncbi:MULTISPECIES: hypothetical protein [Stenotrophomonas]|uniref:hypothetical protein n=1 Tax=Stenotrophomonas TaxID=40323 RepID=UPI001310E3F5|nr:MULTISPECIES: hypothetical protein [unclassified Stenotrophomonas]MDH1242596.1 hypothetical protein [Stenotrophomonas sp. GD03948]MDH1577056.1 hypothetical protein [Stenotrophomonas sp. GD03744]
MIDIEQRITAAIERITSGNAPMRVPADETDPDLVLADCLAEIRRLRAALSARQPAYVQGCDELRARTEGERAAYMEGLEEGKKIAARQPVGEPVGYLYDWTHSSALGRGDEEFTSFTTDIEVARSSKGGINIRPVYAAPTAQAVDLGQFRDLAEFALRNAKLHNCWEKREALARELLDLIGSRDPRHG